MNITKSAACVLAGCVLSTFGAQKAGAVLVNVTGTTPEVVFDSGGFDTSGYTAGTTPSTNSAVEGTYGYIAGATAGGLKVLTGAATSGAGTAGPTGAFAGSNYFTVDRTAANANANTRIAGLFDLPIDATTEAFTLSFAFWATPTGAPAFSLAPANVDAVAMSSAGTPNQLLAFGFRVMDGNTQIIEFRATGTTVLQASNSFTLSDWNTVLLTYDPTLRTASLAVTDASAVTSVVTLGPGTGTPTNGSTLFATDGVDVGSVGRFNIRANSGLTEYIDSVPEPTTFGVAGIACAISLARRRAR
jgi:hypothetical protein